MDSFGGSYLSNNLSNAVSTVDQHKLKHMQDNLTDVDKTAQDFEAMFMSQMLNIMFDSVETDKMFGGGSAEKIYKTMMVDQYSTILSKNDSLGISDQIRNSLLKLQEVKHGAEETGGAAPASAPIL